MNHRVWNDISHSGIRWFCSYEKRCQHSTSHNNYPLDIKMLTHQNILDIFILIYILKMLVLCTQLFIFVYWAHDCDIHWLCVIFSCTKDIKRQCLVHDKLMFLSNNSQYLWIITTTMVDPVHFNSRTSFPLVYEILDTADG